jgi:hypothetical protein
MTRGRPDTGWVAFYGSLKRVKLQDRHEKVHSNRGGQRAASTTRLEKVWREQEKN